MFFDVANTLIAAAGLGLAAIPFLKSLEMLPIVARASEEASLYWKQTGWP